jgi:hypothetical protein
VSPVTTVIRVTPFTVLVRPPGEDVTVYPVIVAPWSLPGAFQRTEACSSPASASTLNGASATVVVVVCEADAGSDHMAAYEAINRETKPTKARELTQRFGIAEPSIGILLKVSFCKILIFT